MMRTDWMRTFVAVADARSFSVAARRLGMTQSAVSKAIGALEGRLDARLLQRSTRAVVPTPEGERFYAASLIALAAIDEAIAAAGGGGETEGLLRITAPLTLAEARIMPMIADFLARHPRLQVDLRLSDQPLDLIAGTIDFAIRVGALTDSALVARRIGTARRLLVASPAYLARNGSPGAPADLAEHDCLPYALLGDGPVWRFAGGERVAIHGPLAADSPIALRAAALAGIGVVANADWLFADDLSAGRLVRVLPDHPLIAMPIHAVLPAARQMATRTRLFLDHIADAFSRDGFCHP